MKLRKILLVPEKNLKKVRNDYFGESTHFGYSAAHKLKSKGTKIRGGKKDKKVMELKATMNMYHDELLVAVC